MDDPMRLFEFLGPFLCFYGGGGGGSPSRGKTRAPDGSPNLVDLVSGFVDSWYPGNEGGGAPGGGTIGPEGPTEDDNEDKGPDTTSEGHVKDEPDLEEPQEDVDDEEPEHQGEDSKVDEPQNDGDNEPDPPEIEFTVRIIYPRNNARIQGDITVTAEASGGIGEVNIGFVIAGRHMGTQLVQSGQASIQVDSSTLPNGNHVIKAQARDALGQQAQDRKAVSINN